jgi:hypothetical protein
VSAQATICCSYVSRTPVADTMKTTIPAATPMIKWVQKMRRRNVRMAGGLVYEILRLNLTMTRAL